MIKLRFLPFLAFLGLIIISCRESVDPTELEAYNGPTNTSINVFLVHSDSAVIRSEITAPKQLEFLNGNQEFPEGIDIKFFTKDGQLETTMRADRGFYMKEENLYRGEGNVQVKNLLKDQSLKSEEIFWNEVEKKIYTDKFVTIQKEQTLFNGTGLEADDSFSEYQLKNPTGNTPLPGEGI